MNVTLDPIFSSIYKNIVQPLFLPITPWSRIIFATSTTAIVGLGAYRWINQRQQKENNPQRAKVDHKVMKKYVYLVKSLHLITTASMISSIVTQKLLEANYYKTTFGLIITPVIFSRIVLEYYLKDNKELRPIVCSIYFLSLGILMNEKVWLKFAVISLIVKGIPILNSYFKLSLTEKESGVLSFLSTLSIASGLEILFPSQPLSYACLAFLSLTFGIHEISNKFRKLNPFDYSVEVNGVNFIGHALLN